MRPMTSEETRGFLLEGTRTGKLATVRQDGRPHVVPIWFVLDGNDVVFTTWHSSVKTMNLRRDGRAAMVVDVEEPPYAYVLVEGAVSFSDDQDELSRVATATGRRYMGGEKADEFGARNAVEGELVVRLRMDRVVSAADITG